MSMIDVEQLTPLALVSQYLLEALGRGTMLSRDDFCRIQKWLELSNSMEDLLIVLDGVLESKIVKNSGDKQKIRSLASIHGIVIKKLRDQRSMTGGSVSL